MKVTIRPLLEPDRELDVTEVVIDAIAGRIAEEFGGNAALDRLEAERQLHSITLRYSEKPAATRGGHR